MTIQEIIVRKEDQTFDCKNIQIDPKALAVPIVAFANADGGVIAIGVSDKTRKVEGDWSAYGETQRVVARAVWLLQPVSRLLAHMTLVTQTNAIFTTSPKKKSTL